MVSALEQRVIWVHRIEPTFHVTLVIPVIEMNSVDIGILECVFRWEELETEEERIGWSRQPFQPELAYRNFYTRQI